MTDKVQRIKFLKVMRDLRTRGLSQEFTELRSAFGLLDDEDVSLVMRATSNVMSGIEKLRFDAKDFEEAMETRLKVLWDITDEELG